ncbi:MAG TPA: FecR domain-containing protein [Rhizomicrobium sp.]|jgi:transmembrane sensor|nr:FecR domain-containing protein [Rhizomicrobium sp.]
MNQSGAVVSDAQGIEARAAAWLIKRREHAWSEPDQAELDAWLAESWAHATAFWRLRAAWDCADRLGVLQHSAPDQVAERRPKSRNVFLAVTAAGLVALALLSVAGSSYLTRSNEKTYATPVGGHEIIVLADGSRVELNTDTSLRVSMGARDRVVTLDRGEAYFMIKHDNAHPFYVLAGGHRVTDIGTAFLVRLDTGRVEIALVEGRARFEFSETGSAGHSSLLMPGDTLLATSRAVSVTKKSATDLASELEWRRNLLVFHHTTLADAANQYNRYNSNKIVIADKAAGRLTLNGTLPTNDVEAFVRLTQKFFDLRIERRGEDIVISR